MFLDRLRSKQIQGAGRKVGPFVLLVGMGLPTLIACEKAGPEGAPAAAPSGRKSGVLQLSDNFAFTIDALRFYCNEPGNWIFSPHGPLELGAAVALGARGKTQEELHSAFHLHSDVPSRTSIPADSLDCEIATSMWISPKARIFRDYKSSLREKFDAELGNGYSAELINDWVSDRTRGHVTNLIENIDPQSRLLLVNAVYFRGMWATPFQESATQPLPFHVDTQTTVEVPTMSRTGDFRYRETDTDQMIVMDYQGGDFVYMCILPHEGKNPTELLQGWTEGTLAGLFQSAKQTQVEVYLPKYSLRWRQSLIPFLISRGVSAAFDQLRGNFSAISSEPLFISTFLQESTFDLDEKGTVATSATVVDMLKSLGYVHEEQRIPVFRADRPFLFLIAAPRARCVLFAGVVANPGVGGT